MKISVICFSLTGQETAERLIQGLRERGIETLLGKKSRYLPDSISEDLKSWTGKQFSQADGIVFIGACGIAVRSIAPFIQNKKKDPAVLVADECGKFVISLLSGHLGGANELADLAADILGAVPVVTTATDLHGRFAVDVFAKKNQCSIVHMKAAKEVSAALLAGESVGFYSEFPWEGELPAGLVLCDRNGEPVQNEEKTALSFGRGEKEKKRMPHKPRTGIAVSIYKDALPFASTVSLIPPVVAVGMGCKKGTDEEKLASALAKCEERLLLYREAICCLASISLKKEEPGLLALAEKLGLSFLTFTEQELKEVPGEFTGSSFVKSVTGVDNVCERSAVLASGQGRLLENKVCREGVTTAAAEKRWRIRFE